MVGLWLSGTGWDVSLTASAGVAVLALGLRSGFGRILFALALGLTVGTAVGGAGEPFPGFDPERPVAVRGRVTSHWSCQEESCSGWFEPLAIHQGQASSFRPSRAWARVYGWTSPPKLGSTLRLRASLRPGRGDGWLLTVKTAALAEVEAEPGPVGRASSALRDRVEGRLREVPEGPGQALLRALLLGDSASLPEAWRRALRRTGLYHLVAVSGLHLALLGGTLWLLSTPLARWRRLRLCLLLFGVAGYVLLVGPVASLLRSALMAGLAVAALWLARPPDSGNALVVSAAGLALVTPGGTQDLSFQLSILATSGLVFLAPQLASRWSFGPSWLRRGLAASVAAELAVLPVALPRFHLLSLAAPLLDLFFVPWSALCLVLCLLWASLVLVEPRLASWIPGVLDVLALPMAWLSAVPGWVPLAVPVSIGTIGAVGLALGLGWWFWGPSRHLRLVLLGLGLVLLRPGVPGGARELVMLDVGQGDALLLRDGQASLLVDGGGFSRGDFAATVLLAALLDEGLPELEAVVLTHGDVDHCGGLRDLASYLRIGALWTAESPLRTGCGEELESRFSADRRRVLTAGQVVGWRGWQLRVLSPLPGIPPEDVNGRSLVLLATSGGTRFLLTGDIGEETERQLVERWGRELEAEVLKVAHHGSGRSSSLPFLSKVRPRLALISAGRGNRYGHPSRAAVERLEWIGARVLSTDRHGRLRVTLTAPRGFNVTPGSFPVESSPWPK